MWLLTWISVQITMQGCNLFKSINKCNWNYRCNFYNTVITDMSRPLVWPFSGWWGQESKYLYSCSHHTEYKYMALWPWRWPHEWPKHVDDYYVIKITFIIPSALLGPFNKLYTYDQRTNMEHYATYITGFDLCVSASNSTQQSLP